MFWNNETALKKDLDTASISQLCYYFDSVERDRLDVGAIGRKAGQVLVLRQKLLSLPEPEFDAAIKTMEKLVDTIPGKNGERGNSASRREALELFEKANDHSRGAKVIPDKVGRV